jgi:phosphoribosylanthranilate isomerase
MKVKICGLRRPADADAAIGLGATHLGVVLAEDSPRCATSREARDIVRMVRGAAEIVLVFRGESDEVIRAQCDAIGIVRVQVHGAGHARCRGLAAAGLLPMPVAVVAEGAQSLPSFAESPAELTPAVLDGGCGGAGQVFPWSLLGSNSPYAVFVAGGIRPTNVRRLLQCEPWGIDVSSGVELEPGVKDPVLMSQLFHAVRSRGAKH